MTSNKDMRRADLGKSTLCYSLGPLRPSSLANITSPSDPLRRTAEELQRGRHVQYEPRPVAQTQSRRRLTGTRNRHSVEHDAHGSGK